MFATKVRLMAPPYWNVLPHIGMYNSGILKKKKALLLAESDSESPGVLAPPSSVNKI